MHNSSSPDPRTKFGLRRAGLALSAALLLCLTALPFVARAAFHSGGAQSSDTLSSRKAAARRGLVAQSLSCANTPTPITYGQTVNGTLLAGDCTNPVDGTLYDAYTFNGVAGQQLVIDETSSAFDAYLYLVRPGETNLSPDPSVTIQDDDSGGGTNARITITLQTTGAYTILADSYGNGITPGGTGAYALTVTQVCSYSLPIASRSVGVHGGTLTDAYTTQAGCPAPSVASNSAFITSPTASAPDASGNGTFSYTVAINTTPGAPRTGTLTVGGQTFSVQQAAPVPGTLQLSSPTYNISEGGGNLVVTVTRTNGSDGAVAVSYSTSNGTATAGVDYAATSGTLNFGDGETTKNFSVGITEDTAVEGNETFNIALSTPTGGASLGSPASATVTINDNDTCSFSINPTNHQSLPAGDAGSVSVTSPVGCSWTATSNVAWITVTSGASGNATGTVGYSVAANLTGAQRTGTVTIAGQTFTVTQSFATYQIAGRITTASGGLSGVTVTLSGGASASTTTDAQGNYSFASVLGGASVTVTPTLQNYTFAPAQQTINVDGDRTGIDFVATIVPAVLQFAQAQYQINEDGSRVNVNVTRGGDTSTLVSVDVRTVDNSAAVPCGDTTTLPGVAFARCDYATSVETLTFAAGETTKTISVPVIDDSWVEPTETFQLALSNATGGASVGAQATATVSITDNDAPGEANPIFQTDFFVRMQYLDFLSREPEAGQPWSAVLNNCAQGDTTCDRISVSANFFRSQEFQLKGLFVYRFYKVAFNRQPLYAEIIPDMRAVTGTTTGELQQKKATFTAAFAQRTEFKNLYDAQTNQQFVDALMNRYNNLQSITTPNPATPDDTSAAAKVTLSRADLTGGLNAATLSRAQVLRAIADSDEVGAVEFNPAFVAMQYFGYLRRDPEASGYQAWLDTINKNPADFRAMVNGFMNSTEYRLRFGQP